RTRVGATPVSEPQQHDKPPELHLIDTKKNPLDQRLNLFRKMAGRGPTPGEIQGGRSRWGGLAQTFFKKATTMNDKPTLHLPPPDEITNDNIMEMFRALTGRDPTPEEVEEARAEWAVSRRAFRPSRDGRGAEGTDRPEKLAIAGPFPHQSD